MTSLAGSADLKRQRRAELDAALSRHVARRVILIVVGIVLLVLAVMVSTSLGVDSMSLGKTARALIAPILPAGWIADISPLQITVLQQLRLPRTLMAVFGGASLSVAGVVLQGITRNPLVSPFTLGISWASAFGASVAILLGLSPYGVVACAFMMALVCAGLVLGFSAMRGVTSIMLILGGVALNFLFQAMSDSARFIASEQQLSALVQWTFGSLNGATWNEVATLGAVFLVIAPVMRLYAWPLNAFAAGGDEVAAALGYNVGRTRFVVTVGAVLLTAAVVSFTGVIGFVGLVAPHIARLLIGGDHRVLLPAGAIVGALLLLVADMVGRLAFAPVIIPVGIVVAYIGVPLFLHLLLSRRADMVG